jgi:hypothetical protein
MTIMSLMPLIGFACCSLWTSSCNSWQYPNGSSAYIIGEEIDEIKLAAMKFLPQLENIAVMRKARF